MKAIIVLIVLGVAGYFGCAKLQDGNPEVIENPVFAEMRVDAKVGGREPNMVLFAEMADDEDYRLRTREVWDETIGSREQCKMSVSACKPELEPRYRRMFENQQTQSTYMSFTRDSRYERGQIECIRGRRD
jgi:hypothetical protein